MIIIIIIIIIIIKPYVDRIYLLRKEGGRGLTQLEISLKTSTIRLDTWYLQETNNAARKWSQKEIALYKKIRRQAETYRKELDIPDLKFGENESVTAFATRDKTNDEKQAQVKTAQKWEEKTLQGKYPSRVKEADVDCSLTLGRTRKVISPPWYKGGWWKSEEKWMFSKAILKTETLLVVSGALGLEKKGLGKYVNKIPGNINIEELQKISLLGTAHILRKVLSTS